MSAHAAIILKNGREVIGIEAEYRDFTALGYRLYYFYNTIDRVKKLLALGDIKDIDINIPDKEFIGKINQDISTLRRKGIPLRLISNYAYYSFNTANMVWVYTDLNEHMQSHIDSLESAKKTKPAFIYLFDESKGSWFISNRILCSWYKEVTNAARGRSFIPLEAALKRFNYFDTTKESILDGCRECRRDGQEHLKNIREKIQEILDSGPEVQPKTRKTVTPRMIVVQANKYFMEAGIQAKLTYTTKNIGQAPGKAVFIRTSNGKRTSEGYMPLDMVRNLPKASQLAREYERQNSWQ